MTTSSVKSCHVMPCIRSIRNNSIAWFKVCQLGPWIYRHVERKIAETIFKKKVWGKYIRKHVPQEITQEKNKNEIIQFSKRCCRDRKRDRRASIPRTHELVALYWSLVWWGWGRRLQGPLGFRASDWNGTLYKAIRTVRMSLAPRSLHKLSFTECQIFICSLLIGIEKWCDWSVVVFLY